MAKARIVPLPPNRSMQDWCTLYVEGKLSPEEYAKGGGIFRLMRICDDSKSHLSCVQAFQSLTKLADMGKAKNEKAIVVNMLPPENAREERTA